MARRAIPKGDGQGGQVLRAAVRHGKGLAQDVIAARDKKKKGTPDRP